MRQTKAAASRFLLVVWLGAVVQERAASAADETTSEAGVGSESSAEERALALRERGRELVLAKDYAGAVPLFEEAYALTGAPRYLFNLGMAHHWLFHCELARGYFEEYVRRDPEGEGRSQADSALEELYAQCGHAPAGESVPGIGTASSGYPSTQSADGVHSPAPAADATSMKPARLIPRPDTDAAGGSGRRSAVWLLWGAGGAAALAGITSGLLMLRTERDLDALRSLPSETELSRSSVRSSWTEVAEREEDALMANGKRYETMMLAFGLGSLALIGAGVTLRLMDDDGGVAFAVSPDGGPSLSYRGAF